MRLSPARRAGDIPAAFITQKMALHKAPARDTVNVATIASWASVDGKPAAVLEAVYGARLG